MIFRTPPWSAAGIRFVDRSLIFHLIIFNHPLFHLRGRLRPLPPPKGGGEDFTFQTKYPGAPSAFAVGAPGFLACEIVNTIAKISASFRNSQYYCEFIRVFPKFSIETPPAFVEKEETKKV